MLNKDFEEWSLGPKIGQGSSAIVFMASNTKTGEMGAIKVINLEDWERGQIDELRREIQLMTLCQHPNLLPIRSCWVKEHSLYILTPLMSGGSCLDVMKSVPSLKEGLDETTISIILLQALQGLDYLHKHGHMHRDIKAANLLLSSDGLVHLADFGVSSSLLEEVGVSANGLGRRTLKNFKSPVDDDVDVAGGGDVSLTEDIASPFFQCPSHLSPKMTSPQQQQQKIQNIPLPSRRRTTFVGTPCWMAPEIMEMGLEGYDQSADIWSLGIMALELANGHAPLSHLPPMKVIQLSIENPPPTLDRKLSKHKYTKTFKEMIDLCLRRLSTKRPSTAALLKHAFFVKASATLERNPNHLRDTILPLLPPDMTERPRIKRLNTPISNPPLIDSMVPVMNHSASIEALNNVADDWDFSNISDDDDVVCSVSTATTNNTENTTITTTTEQTQPSQTEQNETATPKSLRNLKKHSIGRFVVEGLSGDEEDVIDNGANGNRSNNGDSISICGAVGGSGGGSDSVCGDSSNSNSNSNYNTTTTTPATTTITSITYEQERIRNDEELKALSPSQSTESFQRKGRFDVNKIPLILDNVEPVEHVVDVQSTTTTTTINNNTNNNTVSEDGRRSRFQIDPPIFELQNRTTEQPPQPIFEEVLSCNALQIPHQNQTQTTTTTSSSAEDLRFLLMREQMEGQSLQYQLQLQLLQQEKLQYQLQLQQIKEQQLLSALSDAVSSGASSGCGSRSSSNGVCGGAGGSSNNASRQNSFVRNSDSPPSFINPFTPPAPTLPLSSLPSLPPIPSTMSPTITMGTQQMLNLQRELELLRLENESLKKK